MQIELAFTGTVVEFLKREVGFIIRLNHKLRNWNNWPLMESALILLSV